MRTRLLAAALLASSVVFCARAQDQIAEEAADDQPEQPIEQHPAETHTIESAQKAWTVKFEPAAWYPAAEGNLRLPGSASAGNGDTLRFSGLNLDSPRVSPFGELYLKRGDWRISLEGVGFDTSERGAVQPNAGQLGDLAFEAGDTLRSSLEMFTFSVDGAYAFHGFQSDSAQDGRVKVRSALLATAGIRAFDVSIDSELIPMGSTGPSATAGDDALHAHPYAGVRWELEIREEFSVDFELSIGGLTSGDSESWSTDILVGFQWNPTPHLGAQVGYRQLLIGIESGEAPAEFAWQGGLAGVYAGATIRF